MDELTQLKIRVARLENEVAAMARLLQGRRPVAPAQQRASGAPSPPAARPVATSPTSPTSPAITVPASTPVPPGAVARPGPPTPMPPRPSAAESEADLIGTWFARIGVVVLLIGAGFGYRFAVERGIIGPSARVALGVLVGALLLGASEYARGRDWDAFAQALAAGGAAMLTLTVWAASQRYDLLDPAAAFVILALITAGMVALALRYDSEALAAVAAVGGFLNPALVGTEAGSPLALYGYIVLLDVALLAIAHARSWPVIPYVAFAGTALLFAARIDDADAATSLSYATVIFALFVFAPLGRDLLAKRTTRDDEVILLPIVAAAYLGAGVYLVSEPKEALFVAVVGAMMLGASAMVRALEPADRLLRAVYAWIGLAAVTLAVPIGFRDLNVPLLWSIEAAVLIAGGYVLRSSAIIVAGTGLLGLSAWSALTTFERLGGYRPPRMLVSRESVLFSVHLAVGIAAWVAARASEELRRAAPWVAGAVNVWAVMWLSYEAGGHFARAGTTRGDEQALSFTLSAIWALYGVGLLAYGVAQAVRWTRLAGVTLLGIVLGKALLADIWTLSIGHRVIAFIGLGVVLLICSLMYQRFRDLIVHGRPGPDAVDASDRLVH